jgi:hypothetical protein
MKKDMFSDESFSIPLNLSDIVHVCREYNNLGWNLQTQIESILEFGIEDSIKNGLIKKESLPKIEKFLQHIRDIDYFGEASDQASKCIFYIQHFNLHNNLVNLN